MGKIIGNTTATPNPRPDWNQTDEAKADFIKNKPDILTEDDVRTIVAEYAFEGGDTGIIEEADPTVPAWAKQQNPPKLSELENDSGFLTEYTETDPTVPDWAKAETKPTYSYEEITEKPALTTVAISGSYNDLTDKPTIPSTAGLASEEYVNNVVANIGSDLPDVTAEDNCKFLQVVNGEWATSEDVVLEEWVFTLEDGSTVTKQVYVKAVTG